MAICQEKREIPHNCNQACQPAMGMPPDVFVRMCA